MVSGTILVSIIFLLFATLSIAAFIFGCYCIKESSIIGTLIGFSVSIFTGFVFCVIINDTSTRISEKISETPNTETYRCYNIFHTEYKDVTVYKDKWMHGKITGVETQWKSSYITVKVKTDDGNNIEFSINGKDISANDFMTVSICKHYWPNTYYTWGSVSSN